MELNKIYNTDCLEALKALPSGSVDLVVTDPPYEMIMGGGGRSELSKRTKQVRTEIKDIIDGFSFQVLDECYRLCKIPNLYIWCSRLQVPKILNWGLEKNLTFDILIWEKDNPIPAYNHKYLSDKEYCIFLRDKNATFQPIDYEHARSVFHRPVNQKDKELWMHPTIKPLPIIETLILNSSNEGDVILDPFMGSGTTAIGAIKNNRNFIGYEINKDYFDKATERINLQLSTPTLF